jgi:hypothetical protein
VRRRVLDSGRLRRARLEFALLDPQAFREFRLVSTNLLDEALGVLANKPEEDESADKSSV